MRASKHLRRLTLLASVNKAEQLYGGVTAEAPRGPQLFQKPAAGSMVGGKLGACAGGRARASLRHWDAARMLSLRLSLHKYGCGKRPDSGAGDWCGSPWHPPLPCFAAHPHTGCQPSRVPPLFMPARDMETHRNTNMVLLCQRRRQPRSAIARSRLATLPQRLRLGSLCAIAPATQGPRGPPFSCWEGVCSIR